MKLKLYLIVVLIEVALCAAAWSGNTSAQDTKAGVCKPELQIPPAVHIQELRAKNVRKVWA